MTSSSEVPGFYKKKPSERLEYVKNFANLSEEETNAIGGYGALGEETANRMIENVVGTFPLPLVIAALALVFGTLVATSLPIAMAAITVGITMAIVYGIAQFTDVSIFVLNILVFIISLWGVKNLNVENSFINYFKKDSEIY